jgi:hypothetical protein
MTNINLMVCLSEVEKWSAKVETDWKPPEGLFTKSATIIATTLKKNSKDYQEAMQRLVFYINRAGKNLSESRRKELEKAKLKLKKLYNKKDV